MITVGQWLCFFMPEYNLRGGGCLVFPGPGASVAGLAE